MPTDWQVYKNLVNLQSGYDALLSGNPTPHEKYNAYKALLDERWQADLLPVLSDLYWYPFRNGTNGIPEKKRALKGWLRKQYEDPGAVALLLFLLLRYQVDAYNLGGQIGLDFLGIDGRFELRNAEILAALDEHARGLVTQGTTHGIIDNTIDELSEAIPEVRSGNKSLLIALAAFIGRRSAERTVTIERTERPYQVGNALDEVYQRNGLRYKMYDVAGIGCKKICAPWHGQIFEVGRHRNLIPQHPNCDCVWTPARYNGQTIGVPPVTINAPFLPPWQPPASAWTGA